MDDQVGSPTYAGHLAAAVDEALRLGVSPGLYHMAGSGYCSWNELAREIVALARDRPSTSSRITTAELGRPARRPAFSALASERPIPRLPHWADGRRRGGRPADGRWSRLRMPPVATGARRRRAAGSSPACGAHRPRRGSVRIVVTGGAGFIGSNFVRHLLRAHADVEVVNLDKLTYAGNLENLRDVRAATRATASCGATSATPGVVRAALAGVDAVVNFAAETHVDRSISDPQDFIRTDVLGTHTLLEAVREHGVGRFLQISTDEVYGSIDEGSFTERSDLDPSSPYSASKAGADLLVLAFHRTYGLPVVITRSSNNYGPYQYPEKIVPLFITNALDDQPLPVYGDGAQRARLALRRGQLRARIDLVLREGRAGRGLQRRRRQRGDEHRRDPPHPRAARQGRRV